MIYFELFITFFKIGLFTFGGGYAMIPMINDEVIKHGWLSMEFLIDFIAIAESTPGPFAIDIATFIGFSQGGIFGAICAVFGVVLPSIIIIVFIAKIFNNLTEKKGVQYAFNGLRPAVVGLLTYALFSIAMPILLNIDNILNLKQMKFDYIATIIFIIVLAISFIKIKKKKISPVLLMAIGAVLGIISYGVIAV